MGSKRWAWMLGAVVVAIAAGMLAGGCSGGCSACKQNNPWAGTWAGTFSGDVSGTWTATISSCGVVVMTVTPTSGAEAGTGNITVPGVFGADTTGTLGASSAAVTWSGTAVIGTMATITGTWHTTSGTSRTGTFTGTWQD
jgi:hypothetical protein